MKLDFAMAIFHVGNPFDAKPHHDASLIQKWIKENPDVAFVIVLKSEAEQKEVEEKLKTLKIPEFHPGALVCVWDDDELLLDDICQNLQYITNWKIVGPMWYECEKAHVTKATGNVTVEKCETCGDPVKNIELEPERAIKFAQILHNAYILMRFDTRSAHVLSSLINPTRNVMLNMPYALGLPSAPALRIEDYVGRGKGKTAICVSAGPSLKHAIPHLKRLQEQAVIISVARAYKRLKAEGIRQDYTMSCEMFDWDAAIFDGLTKEDVGDTILLYPQVCSPATVAKWPGKSICCFDHPAAALLGRQAMTGGNSVSHHIYNWAAEVLKCDRVILVGQDLAYTEPSGETHAAGTTPQGWPEASKDEDSRKQEEAWDECQTQLGPFHGEATHKTQAEVAPGAIVPIGKVMVRTSGAYRCFRDLFDILIKRAGVPTWNACPNGLKINRAKYVDLAAVTDLKDVL